MNRNGYVLNSLTLPVLQVDLELDSVRSEVVLLPASSRNGRASGHSCPAAAAASATDTQDTCAEALRDPLSLKVVHSRPPAFLLTFH